MQSATVDLEKNRIDADGLSDSPSRSSSESSSESSSGPSFVLKAKAALELKPNRDILPKKTGNKITRYLKFNFWTTYNKIFTFIYVANMATLIAFCVENNGTPAPTRVVSATSANLMFTALFRQENVVNLAYDIATSAPHSFPLPIRRRLAKVFHYGGGHSGSAVAAVCWIILYGVLVTRVYVLAPDTGARANVITSWILVAMYALIACTSHPRLRILFHTHFQVIHRTATWIAVLVFWLHIGLVSHYSAAKKGTPLGHFLIREPNFWFIGISTLCNILNWLRLRRRQVFPEVLSDNAIRLHFKYRSLQPFYGIKLSTSPLKYWQAFPTTPDEDENGKINGFSIVVSNTSDWARDMIKNPSKNVWIRGYPLHGYLYTSRLFKRIVVVATGSGIDACLSLFYANATPCRVLWAVPHPETTYGPKVMNAVLKADPDAVVWNTHTLGRPDMVALTYQLLRESNAEAVFVVSDRHITRKVVYAMETRGIPAYGSIFDS